MNIKIKIPKEVNRIISILQDNGYSAYIVGGSVRDSILKRPVHDWDVCTSASPNAMLEIFKDRKVIETGLKHGTVTVIENEKPIEITTFRIDGDYSDNRRSDSVEFTDDLFKDLIGDINRRIVKCVGNAKDRFNEDALRILRAIRFSAQLNFKIEEQTMMGIYNQYENLKNISIERINSEFCKIVSSKTFDLKLLFFPNVFSLFIPELTSMFNFDQNNPHHEYSVFMHTVNAIKQCSSKDFVVRLAVFFHDFGKPHCYQDGKDGIRHFKGHGKVSADIADSIMKRLRFDNETRNNVTELVYYHDATFEVGYKYVKRWLNKIGEKQFRRLLELRKADIKGQRKDYELERIEKVEKIESILEEVLQDQACFSLKDLAIDGNDVKEVMKLKEGRTIGYWLNEILKRVIDGDLENDRNKLICWMKVIVNNRAEF